MSNQPHQSESVPAAVLAELAALAAEPVSGMTDIEQAALRRLIYIAQGNTGQSRRVADFLLAWWSAGSCGGFDLTTLWGIDTAVANDMVTVFALIARVNSYPDTLGYEADFKAIMHAWRPELAD